ncbi:MAG: methionine gamma-lyase family protein [Firmicutes bacterium]|nr:methionine gamma-lyase family protein [Bacillota bacterium]
MSKNKFLKENFGLSEAVLNIVEEAETTAAKAFRHIEDMAEINEMKVMKAFADNRLSAEYFMASSGYGSDDIGRDMLDKIYAQVFESEDALVRYNFISGTHTLSTMLFGVLRPGDTVVAITGKPYDTLEEVIGIVGKPGNGSLKDFGINYKQIDLKSDSEPDYNAINKELTENKIKAVWIQRSKGYGERKTFSAKEIGKMIKFVKEISPDTLALVDNCYGEFTDDKEPTYYGADLCGGSLIKNAGGGIAPTGGYIAGKEKYINLCAYRLSTVGIGRENGATLGINKCLYQGLFFAPHVVSQALKSAVLCAAIYEKLGFEVEPRSDDVRHDIIQRIKLGSEKAMIAFCRGIQLGSPVDAYVKPEPSDMPGYQEKVIMAAGAFNQGSSIELSADGPIKPPYTIYMQGGLTYESAKLGIIMSVQSLKDEGVI